MVTALHALFLNLMSNGINLMSQHVTGFKVYIEDVFCAFTDKPENTMLKSSTSVGCVSDSLTLNCTSQASPPPHNYQFYRNDVLIANSSTGLFTYNMTTNGTNVYTCVPENSVGPGLNNTAAIQVKGVQHIFKYR